MRRDFTDYTFKKRNELFDRYSQVVTELANLNIELSELLQDEHRQKIHAWQESEEQSVTGRDRYASASIVHITTEIHRVRGEILAVTSEKDLIEFFIKEGVTLDG